MEPAQDVLLAALAETVVATTRTVKDRNALLIRGNELNIPKTTLAATAKLSRRAVYDILAKHS